MLIKTAGTWKRPTTRWAKIAGVWKPITQEYVKVAGVWMLISDWLTRKTVTFASTTYAGVQVRLVLTPANFTYATAKVDGSDLRFTKLATDDPATQALPYWIESWVNGGTSVVWFKVPTAAMTNVFMHYGNPNATDAQTAFATFMERGFRWASYSGVALAGAATYGGNDLKLEQASSATQTIAGQAIGTTNVSARWEGWVVPEYVGDHQFGFNDDDGGRSWLDGAVLHTDWGDSGAVEIKVPTTILDVKPKAYRFEWYNSTGNGQYAIGLSARTGRRTNWVPNPSFEVDLAGWVAGTTGMTMQRNPTLAYAGGACMQLGRVSAAGEVVAYLPGNGIVPVSPGVSVAGSFYMALSSAAGATGYVQVTWYDKDHAYLTTSQVSLGLTTSWQKLSVAAAAPANAAFAGMTIYVFGVPTGVNVFVDAVMLEISSYALAYFDGSYPACGWYGTPHASASYLLSSVRANGAPNPRALVNTAGWSPISADTYTRVMTDGVIGATCFDVVKVAAGGTLGLTMDAPWIPVVPGETWQLSAYVKSTNSVEPVRLHLVFVATDGSTTALDVQGTNTAMSTTWQLISVSGVAPVNAAFVRTRLRTQNGSIGTGVNLRATGFLLERSASLGSYFDGDLAPARWVGTPRASAALLPITDRANHVPNPQAEVDLAHWTKYLTDAANNTFDRYTGDAKFGSACFRAGRITSAATTGFELDVTSRLPVAPGDVVQVGFWVKGVGYTGGARITLSAYDASGASLGNAGATVASISTSAWTWVTGSYTMPANTATVKLVCRSEAAVNVGQYVLYDGIIVERSSTVIPSFFDGSIAGSEWMGTSHDSPSRRPTPPTAVTYPIDRAAVFGPKWDPAYAGLISTQTAVVT